MFIAHCISMIYQRNKSDGNVLPSFIGSDAHGICFQNVHWRGRSLTARAKSMLENGRGSGRGWRCYPTANPITRVESGRDGYEGTNDVVITRRSCEVHERVCGLPARRRMDAQNLTRV